MVRQTTSLVILEILGGLMLLVLVGAGLLIFRLSSGPIELGMLKDDVQAALTRARNGRPVTLDKVYLEWSSEDHRVYISGYGLKLLDDEGDVAAESQRANIVLSGSSLVFGDVEVLRLRLENGWINVDEQADGSWTVAGDPLPPLPAGALPQNPSEWLIRINAVLPQILDVLQEAQTQFSLEELSFEQFVMRVRDKEGGPILQLVNSEGQLVREDDGLLLAVSGQGDGAGLPAGLAVKFETDNVQQRMQAEFAAADWPLDSLLARLGLGQDALSGQPADINIFFDTSKAAGVERMTLTAELSEGLVPNGETGTEVTGLEASLSYAAQDDILELKADTTRTGPFGGDIRITLKNALKGTGPRPFEIVSDEMTLDLTPMFEAPLTVSAVTGDGLVELTERGLRETNVEFQYGEAVFRSALDITLTEDRQPGEPRILGVVELETEGVLPRETVLAFWPVKLGESARSFTATRIEGTEVTDIRGRIELSRDSLADGHLRDDDLNLTFNVTDGRVQFLDDLPPVEKAAGRGRLTGNSFRVLVDSAEYGGWVVDEGLVDFPAFNPRGEDFRVFAKGHGPAENIIRVLNESRLELDFDAERLSGQSEITYEMFRPALEDVPFEDVRFSAVGTLQEGGLKNAALGLDLTEAVAKINVDQGGIVITGQGSVGPSPIQFTWRDSFSDDEDAPSVLTANVVINPDVLNRFGLPGRAYLTGEIPTDIQATIDGESVSVANVSMDMTQARVDLSEIGWIKSSGKPGKASVVYERTESGFSSDVLFTGDDVFLDGSFELGENSRLISAEVRRAYLADTADVKGTVGRGADGNLEVNLTGTYLDMSGALPGVGAIGDANQSGGTPLKVRAAVDTLELRPGLNVRDADVSWLSTMEGMQTLSASGKADDGSPFAVDLDATGAAGTQINVKSGNAGFLANAFLGLDFIEGGELELDGLITRDESPSQLNLVITNGRMRNAPFLTQILSLASLRGLADTLGGEGVLFSRIDLPLTIAGGRYVVNGARAQGPALGLTANGYLQGDGSEVGIDGVLVPSFGMNSALGTIPIIGDLVVGRDGEGVFSLTYSVRGSLEKANVSVNPLSALAPGVIRRIFENPTDTTIPEATPRAPDEPIPSELPPIPEEEF